MSKIKKKFDEIFEGFDIITFR